MKLMKKLAKVLLIAVIAITSVSTMKVYAGDDNLSFKFQIGAVWGNGRVEEGEYRQTKKPKNAWKVQLVTTQEGNGKVASFWLERYDGGNVSNSVDAQQGAAPYYVAANSSASQCTVYLTGQNNNFDLQSYYVSGIWDEETGVILD